MSKAYRGLLMMVGIMGFAGFVFANPPRVGGPSTSQLPTSTTITLRNESDLVGFLKNTEAPIVLDFMASWCAPCQAMEKHVRGAVQRFGNQAMLIKIDIDEHRSLARKYGVRAVPTLIIMQQEQETGRMLGFQNEAAVLAAMKRPLPDTPATFIEPDKDQGWFLWTQETQQVVYTTRVPWEITNP